jgi:protein Tex
VHISELSDRFVKDPREVVKAGDVVKVRVKDVDVARKRIALTMKSGAIDRSAGGSPRPSSPPSAGPRAAAPPPRASSPQPPAESALAAALRRAQERK